MKSALTYILPVTMAQIATMERMDMIVGSIFDAATGHFVALVTCNDLPNPEYNGPMRLAIDGDDRFSWRPYTRREFKELGIDSIRERFYDNPRIRPLLTDSRGT